MCASLASQPLHGHEDDCMMRQREERMQKQQRARHICERRPAAAVTEIEPQQHHQRPGHTSVGNHLRNRCSIESSKCLLHPFFSLLLCQTLSRCCIKLSLLPVHAPKGEERGGRKEIIVGKRKQISVPPRETFYKTRLPAMEAELKV